jgi:hypothetical protein
VRNPQAPGPRSRSARCSWRRRYDARIPPIFADHLHSSVLCIQCRQARGGISLVAISVRACMPGQRIFTSRTGYWYTFFNFDLTGGSLGNTEADWRHWRQTRFGHARSERRRPQFTAHNSVRPLKNGLSLGGSSATRPILWLRRFKLPDCILKLQSLADEARESHFRVGLAPRLVADRLGLLFVLPVNLPRSLSSGVLGFFVFGAHLYRLKATLCGTRPPGRAHDPVHPADQAAVFGRVQQRLLQSASSR